MKKEGFLYEFKKNKALFAMAAPAFILVLVMQYFPMSDLILHSKSISTIWVCSAVPSTGCKTSVTCSIQEPAG